MTNNLNQYSSVDSLPITYDATGNFASFDGATASYDAQNRLISVDGTYETFKYDGLNRQVSRTINGATIYTIWDGWNLLVSYNASNQWIEAHDIGAGGLTEADQHGYYYYDASGSTSHLADDSGNLLEWYRYDLQGVPVFYNFANTQQSASAYGVRQLFTGQQWYPELGLYDMRNRFYSPGMGRFLQPDPIDFNGDPTNLYRYCANNPLVHSDASGLFYINYGQLFNGLGNAVVGYVETEGSVALGFASAESLIGPAAASIGVADGGIRFQYGVANTIGAFIDSDYGRGLQAQPSSIGQYIGKTLGGEKGQYIGGVVGGGARIGTARDITDGLAGTLELINEVMEQIMSSTGGIDEWVGENGLPPGDYNTPADNPSDSDLPSLNMAYFALTYADGSRGSRGHPQYNPIGSGMSIGPTSFEGGTGLYNAFEGGNTVPAGGLILGGLPGGSAYGWGPRIL